ncbi:MAG: hypothetical protein ACOYJ1_03460 [Peptococcales bacterium]|jgi:hypothetical protein
MVQEPEKKQKKKWGFWNLGDKETYEFSKEFDPENPHKMFEKVRDIDVDGQGTKKS